MTGRTINRDPPGGRAFGRRLAVSHLDEQSMLKLPFTVLAAPPSMVDLRHPGLSEYSRLARTPLFHICCTEPESVAKTLVKIRTIEIAYTGSRPLPSIPSRFQPLRLLASESDEDRRSRPLTRDRIRNTIDARGAGCRVLFCPRPGVRYCRTIELKVAAPPVSPLSLSKGHR
jgi:hypothetical protein